MLTDFYLNNIFNAGLRLQLCSICSNRVFVQCIISTFTQVKDLNISSQLHLLLPVRLFMETSEQFCYRSLRAVLCLQLCLSGLSDRSRLQANAAILGVSLLMEDVLNSGGEAEPVRLHGNKDDLLHDGKPNEVKACFLVVMASRV